MLFNRHTYRILFSVSLVLLLTWPEAIAQGFHGAGSAEPADLNTPLFTGPVRVFTIDDGLPDLHVTDFLEDEHGFIWISTNSGVVRCDGRLLHSVEIPIFDNAFHTCLAEDTLTHTVWIGGGKGLFVVNSLTGEAVECLDTNGMAFDNVYHMAVDRRHRLWVGMESGYGVVDLMTRKATFGTLRCSRDSLVNVRANRIFAVLPDPADGSIVWFGTRAGLVRWNTENAVATLVDMDLPGFGKAFTVTALAYDRYNDELLVGVETSAEKYLSFDFLRFDHKAVRYLGGLATGQNWISKDILVDGDRSIWLIADGGVAQYNVVTQAIDNVIAYQPDAVFPGKIDFIDKRRMIWTTTHAGVSVFKPRQTNVDSYYYRPGNPRGYHVCSDIRHRSGKVYMSVYGGEGVYVLDLQSREWTLLRPAVPEGSFFSGVSVDFDAHGQMLVTSNLGFYREAGDILQKVALPLDTVAHRSWQDAEIGPDGYVWAASKSYLYRMDMATGTIQDFSQVLQDCDVNRPMHSFVTDPRGNFWFYGPCVGWSVFDPDKGEFIHSRHLDNTDGQEILGQVLSVAADDQYAYVVNYGLQVGRLNLDNISAGTETYYDLHELYWQQHGGSDSIDYTLLGYARSAALDTQGLLWIITTNRVLRMDMQTAEIMAFDEEDGFVLNDREMQVFVADHLMTMDDGRFVYSTRKGVHTFDPAKVVSSQEKTAPYLTSVFVNGRPYHTDTLAAMKQQYTLKPVENNIAFDFSAKHLSSAQPPRFAHRLSPLDEAWVESSRGNHIAYANLPAGDYTLSLRVADATGNWSPEICHVSLRIGQYWWRTMYARSGAVLLIGLVVFGWYRYRMRSILQREKLSRSYERKLAEVKMNMLTAQMNPHFIFNSLNSIDYYIIKNDTLKASDYLNRFARLIRLILNHSRSNYITLAEELEALRLYIEIESLRFNGKFDYVVRAGQDVDLDAIQIPPMLFQPYVENAIWHGLMHKETKGCLEVDVRMAPTGEALVTTITDNGIGRAKARELNSKNAGSEHKKSMGMSITHDKIEVFNYLHDLNATVKVEDLVGSGNGATGTRVILNIPI